MITVEFSPQQIDNLLTLLDVAVRASGLVNARPAIELENIVKQAIKPDSLTTN